MRTSMYQARRWQRGFTGAELQVLLFLSGMLIALLLPAVQQAREAARKARCQDHLHNLVIALHNYQDAYRVLPPGWVHQAPQRSNYGWATSLLPFSEQSALYNQLRMGHPALAEALADPQREGLHQTIVEVYRCPSDIGPPLNSQRKLHDQHDEPRTVALANYVAINGGGEWTRGQELRGCFGENSATTLREITDGVSSTLFCGERIWRIGQSTCAAAVSLGVHGDGKTVREDDTLAIGLYPLNAQQGPPRQRSSPVHDRFGRPPSRRRASGRWRRQGELPRGPDRPRRAATSDGQS